MKGQTLVLMTWVAPRWWINSRLDYAQGFV
jgi:hypothetical protein